MLPQTILLNSILYVRADLEQIHKTHDKCETGKHWDGSKCEKFDPKEVATRTKGRGMAVYHPEDKLRERAKKHAADPSNERAEKKFHHSLDKHMQHYKDYNSDDHKEIAAHHEKEAESSSGSEQKIHRELAKRHHSEAERK